MSRRERTALRLKRAARHMKPTHIIATHLTRRVFEAFADRVGLVYFGYVDQRDDDHRLIRGHTVSATHQDNHYCIGSIRGYDVMMVLRNDVVKVPGQSEDQRCHWLICTVDLHTRADIPHFYVGHRNRDAVYGASYGRLSPMSLGALGAYPYQFLSEYTVYGTSTHAIEIEQTFPPQMAAVVASHFQHASFEVQDGTVYLYIENPRPDGAALEKMLSNALWVAEAIDTLRTPKPLREE